jgi:hypothetical protein
VSNILIALLKPTATHLADKAAFAIKRQLQHWLVAVALVLLGVAMLIAALSYLASAIWHALSPAIGSIGADLVIGGSYCFLAATSVSVGLRMVRT